MEEAIAKLRYQPEDQWGGCEDVDERIERKLNVPPKMCCLTAGRVVPGMFGC